MTSALAKATLRHPLLPQRAARSPQMGTLHMVTVLTLVALEDNTVRGLSCH